MEIEFASDDLKALCEVEKVAKRKLGPESAKKLKSRLSDLEAVETVAAIVVGSPHPLRGDRDGQFAVSLHGGDRLVFEAADEPVPKREKKTDWTRVRRVRIIYVGDYHD